MTKQKKPRKNDDEKLQIIASLVMLDDAMFEAMCESPEFIEEMLQTIFDNPNLRIIYDSVVPQKSIKNLKGRSVRLDAYVIGEEQNVFNIEVQQSNDCNHVKRVRYNASIITSNNSEPGDAFEDIQNLCMVYITKSDFFKMGRTIYHVQSTIQETGDTIDNGLTEIYVNTEVNDGSKVADLMAMFKKKELDEGDRENFPCTYRKYNSLKHDKQEVDHMCDKIEKYAEKYARDKEVLSAIKSYEEFDLSRDDIVKRIMSRFDLTEEEANAYYDDAFAVV